MANATKKRRKKRVARSESERLQGILANARAFGWKKVRDAMERDEGMRAVGAGIIRARRDVKRFSFFGNPDAVAARAKALRDRAARIEEVAEKVQNGEIGRSTVVENAGKAFDTLAQRVFQASLSGQNVDVPSIFAEVFPASDRKALAEYAETADPFIGTDDESEDSDDDDGDDSNEDSDDDDNE